jgi:hypothetical protein
MNTHFLQISSSIVKKSNIEKFSLPTETIQAVKSSTCQQFLCNVTGINNPTYGERLIKIYNQQASRYQLTNKLTNCAKTPLKQCQLITYAHCFAERINIFLNIPIIFFGYGKNIIDVTDFTRGQRRNIVTKSF